MDCRRFGVDPAAFAHLKANRPDDDPIPIWPDMKDPFALFCDAPWQWVSLGMSGVLRTNIQRTELEASARLLGVTMTPAIFSDIRTMEDEALKFWSRRNGR